MKCIIPEISWHNRDPVLSVDIQPKTANDNSELYRLASGGTDSHVLVSGFIIIQLINLKIINMLGVDLAFDK